MQTALALFNEALGLAERSGLPCDALKANILSWRSRCWQRQRDFEAARDDVERALELSQGVEDLRTIGAAYFQDLFETKVWGVINFGLVFALSQFAVAWGIAFYYAKRASQFDAMAKAIVHDYAARG